MTINMKNQDLKEISTEQLQQQIKTIKNMSIAFVIMLIVLLGIGIYVSMGNSELASLVIAPFILSPILYVFSKKALIIKGEIESRG